MSDLNNNIKEQTRSLKISETDSKFVGKGMALVDPKVMEEMDLTPGDVIEITNKRNKSTFALLWFSSPTDYDKGLIRIDGYTRNNLSEGIDDRTSMILFEVNDPKPCLQ